MAPTSSSTLTVHSSNLPSGRHFHEFHRLRHQVLGFSPGQYSALRVKRFKRRTLDPASQPSTILKGPTPPPFSPTGVLIPEPSVAPVKSGQPQSQGQQGDLPGDIVAAVVVIVLVLGGLMGLIVGGEMLRRQAKATGKMVSPPSSRCIGRRKPKRAKDATTSESPLQGTNSGREKFGYDEKTLTPLARPPPALNRERQRGLVDIWPIRSLSRAMYSHRKSPEQAEECRQQLAPDVVGPQTTTWSEFAPLTLYVPPRRAVLARIPEECEEDCQSLTSGTGQSLECDYVPARRRWADNTLVEECDDKAGEKDDARSLGSTAPDMTYDGGESSESSMVSLESVEDGESVREEVFELRRAQTRSMQMNKGVLLSLSTRTLPATSDGRGPSRGGVVDLDEFPSPPSLLPMIPSYVSGF